MFGLTASAAHADRYVRGPIYRAPTVFSWTGFYIGGHVGGAWSRIDWSDVSLTGEPVDNDSRGFIGGGQVGFNWQAGNIVVGIEATYSGTNLDGSFTSAVTPSALRVGRRMTLSSARKREIGVAT